MQEGKTVKRVKVGQKGLHGKGLEPDENIGEEGIVIRDFSWKWMKIDIGGEAEWVRCEDFQEV